MGKESYKVFITKTVVKSLQKFGFNCFEKSVNAIAEVMDVLYTQTPNGTEGRDVSERRGGHSRMSADTCEFFPHTSCKYLSFY